MPATPFWTAKGFRGNPFEYANADQENMLSSYFVEPPHFSSVRGDPDAPASAAVFAPRGGGKSAQRIMVEQQYDSSVLMITCADFPLRTPGTSTAQLLEYHLRNINQHTIISLLAYLRHRFPRHITEDQASTLRRLAHVYLSDVDQFRLQGLLNSLRNMSETSAAYWRTWVPQLGTLAAYGLASLVGSSTPPGPLQLPDIHDNFTPSPLQDFRVIGELAIASGIKAIYVLIDRVDELPFTQTSHEAAYNFIAPLISNLSVIETKPYAFKFFLTSELEDLWREAGGRPDRVRSFITSWSSTELIAMVDKRLRAFLTADNQTRAISIELMVGTGNWRDAVLLFSQNSPRDLIRILDQIYRQATRTGDDVDEITDIAKAEGINEFCRQRAAELAGRRVIEQLQRIQLADFRVYDAAGNLQVGPQSARNYIAEMERRGIVKRVPGASNMGQKGRPDVWYAIQDVRIARVAFPDMPLTSFLTNKVRLCVNQHAVIRDWDGWNQIEGSRHTCQGCGAQLEDRHS